MHVKQLLVLVLVVAGLGALLYFRRAEPEFGEQRSQRMFEGVDPARVVGLRIDNLERTIQLKLERDAAGRWFLTDPVPYAASDAAIDSLMGIVTTNHGVVRADVEPGAVGLDPPRALLEAIELVNGERVRTAVELGAVDVNSGRCWARRHEAGAPVLLTLRNFDTALDRTPDQFRDRRLLYTRPEEIIELQRFGSLAMAPGLPPTNLDMVAEVEGVGTWGAVAPARARLDGVTLGLLAQGLCTMRVQHFYDDSLDDLATYGLDEPALRIEVRTASGGKQSLRFAIHPNAPEGVRPENNYWLAMREGFPFVWEVDGKDVRLLSSPFEQLLDYRLAGVQRQHYTEVVLGGERPVRLVRVSDRKGERWTLQQPEGAAADASWNEPLPADAGRVEDLLVGLESAELMEWLPGLDFADGEVAAWFRIGVRDGAALTGEFGPEHQLPDGRAGRLFRRRKDLATFLAADELFALVRPDPGALRSLVLHELDETLLARLEVSGAGARRVYLRRADGRWFQDDDSEREARELWSLLDGLVTLRAERWLDSPATAPLAEAIEVTFTDAGGAETAFEVGSDERGGTEVREAGRRAALTDLHERLVELLGR